MNVKRRKKQKRALSLVVTFAMLLSSVGTAAAEPVETDAQPTVAVDSEPEPTLVMTEEETEEKSEEETESKSEEETEEETESEPEEGTEEETEEETETESEEGTEEETETEPEEGTGEETEEETEGETETEPEEGTVEETEEETETEPEEGTVEETEEETETEPEEGTGEETEEETEGETETEPEKGTVEETEEETETEPEGGTVEETEEETEAKPEEETGEEAETKPEEGSLPEDSDDKLSAGLEAPGVKPPVALIPALHEHGWSVTWTYDGSCHWHECDAEDCPVADDSEKDGYEEHTYDDYGVCTVCGYDAMDGIAVAAVGAVPTYAEAYEAMYALKEMYPEGMTWTNFEPYGSNGSLGDAYTWKGGAIYGAQSAVGCMAFAFILSDEAFGNLPARAISKGSFTFEDVKVGDILRINGNSHSVIVLKKSAGGVTVAEANYNKSVHWGRAMSEAAVMDADFIITRYPKDYIPSDTSDADEVIEEGEAGALSWSLTKAGELTISGNGAIPDYSSNNPSPWSEYSFSTIVIEEGVTGIGDYAFYGSQVLSVYIPDTVTAIGTSAFDGSQLVAVTIPGSVKTIGDSAFQKCENLTSASVSEGVEVIGETAFQGCTALNYIDFPASITSIGAGAFASCEKIVSVRFMPGSGAVEIGENLFSQCWNLASVTLPQTIDRISAGMFASCTLLPELYIPASVKSIGDGPANTPFTSCDNLRVIYFGGSEAEWDSMMNPYLLPTLMKTTIKYNVDFDDPFATDPDDPGDFQPNPGDDGDNTEPGGDEGTTEPGGDEGTTTPGGDEGTTKPGGDEGTTTPGGDEGTNKPGGDEGTTTPGGDEGTTKPGGDEGTTTPGGDEGTNKPGGDEGTTKPGGDEGTTTPGGDEGTTKPGGDEGTTTPGGNEGTTKPGGDEGTTTPGGDEGTTTPGGDKKPSGSGGSNTGGSNTGSSSSDDSSGSSNDSAGNSSGEADRSSEPDDSGNVTVSTTIRRNSDNSKVVTTTQKNGTVATVTTDAAGKVAMEVRVSGLAVSTSEQTGRAVVLPVSPVQAVRDAALAAPITVHTEREELVRVAIPAVSPTAGTVAVIVNEDGSTEVIKGTVPTENSIVAFLPDGATIKIVDNSVSFPDVPAGAWFEEAVAFVSARDLFYGTAETVFAPDGPMTCAMLVTALARFDGAETEGGAAWYDKSMEWAAARGISAGVNPGSNLNHEQLVTMLWKYAGSPAAASDQGADEQMSDVQKAMSWAAGSGIVSGFEDGALAPQGQVNRAQAAQLIMNLVKKTAVTK